MRYKYAVIKHGELVLDVCIDTQNNTLEGIFATDSEQDIADIVDETIKQNLKDEAIDRLAVQNEV